MASLPCPHCQAPLKTSAPLPVGMTVRCPKCSQTFNVAETPAPALLSLDDAPPPPPPSARDRHDDDPSPRRAASSLNAKLYALIGGGVLVLGLVIGLVIYLTRKKEEKKEEGAGAGDMVVYFPADTEEISFYNLEALGQIKQFRERFSERIKNGGPFELLRAAKLDFDGLARAAECRTAKSEAWIFVTRKPLDKAALIKNMDEKTVKDRKYYGLKRDGFVASWVYFASETMAVAAPREEFITAILERETGKAVAPAEIQELVRKGAGASHFRGRIRKGDEQILRINGAPQEVQEAAKKVKGRTDETRINGNTLERTTIYLCASSEDAAKIASFAKTFLEKRSKAPAPPKAKSEWTKEQEEALQQLDNSLAVRAEGRYYVETEKLNLKPFESARRIPLLPY